MRQWVDAHVAPQPDQTDPRHRPSRHGGLRPNPSQPMEEWRKIRKLRFKQLRLALVTERQRAPATGQFGTPLQRRTAPGEQSECHTARVGGGRLYAHWKEKNMSDAPRLVFGCTPDTVNATTIMWCIRRPAPNEGTPTPTTHPVSWRMTCRNRK